MWWQILLLVLGWLLVLPAGLWAFGALWFDFPWRSQFIAWAWVAVILLGVWWIPPAWGKLLCLFVAVLLVVLWWAQLAPRHDREWATEVARMPSATMNDGLVTIENVRNFDFRSREDFTPNWTTRTVDPAQITGMDIAINYWGSPWLAHPILCITFADQPPLAFSIEIRPRKRQKFSALGGFYRRFELIMVVAEEIDLLGLRVNHRREEVFLYRTKVTPARARERFLEYVDFMNELREHPRWYHAITTNCTTALRGISPPEARLPWDWRFLINGKGDRMLAELGLLALDGQPFDEVRPCALLQPPIPEDEGPAAFSRRIRENRIGFPESGAGLFPAPG
jgi:hypothetical protein